jgi:hypothetical protein
MASTDNDLTNPFLSPGEDEVVEKGPNAPVDGSAEGMRRLRDPFTVEPSGAQAATAGEDPNGHRRTQEGDEDRPTTPSGG